MIDPTTGGIGGAGVAFGAGKAGGGFDPFSFISRPQVILRILCWVSQTF